MEMNGRGKQTSEQILLAFLAGGGEMGERTRAFDWSNTLVGPVAGWPQSLKIAVRIMLDSRYAMWLGWGPDFTFFYNDAYARMTLGPKHPWALGRSAREVWSEIWGDIGPRAESVVRSGQATWDEGLLLFLERRGFPEETYHTFSYSPIPGDQAGVGGMLCVVTEDTERTIGERRLRTLRELAARTTEQAKSAEVACQTAIRTLAENRHDIPFVLIYLLDADVRTARLAGATGLPECSPASPQCVDLAAADGPHSTWPLRSVLESGRAEVVTELGKRFGSLPGGVWPEPPERAVVLPMAKPGQARLAGFVVAGVSPRLAFDDGYKGFMDLLAAQVASAVTNARAYEEERQRAEALAELDRAKTAFFSNVSHEFRTPLTLILGPVDDALAGADGELPPLLRERLEVAHRNGLRLQRLVNTLLDFSRIEAGRVRASYEPTDLAAFTADLASNFRSACEKAGLELTVDCPPLEEPVFVDRQMWEKVVLNLLSNAFKFTFEGEIGVSLMQGGSAVELRVRDTGTGIPSEEMPRLFERFHRVENARGRTHEGSGIGLALVQELVRLHGGSISAESEVGRGTTFIVTVPLGSAHLPPEQVGGNLTADSTTTGATPFVEEALRWLPDGQEDPDAFSELPAIREDDPPFPLPTSRQPEGDRPRVLVADDNADMRRYVVRLLTGQYSVEAVTDGAAALASVRRQPPDLILSDVMMPRLNGFELLRELRADPRTVSVPVILLSARAGEQSRVEGVQAGADDYLVKPFSSRELLARVSAHLQMARLRREANESLRASEERFRTLFESMDEAFCVVEMLYDADNRPADYRFLEANPTFGRHTGFADAIGRTIRELVPDHDAHWFEIYGAVAATGEPIRFVNEAKAMGRWYDVYAHRVGGPDSRKVGILFTDITARKRADDDLRQMAAALSEADRRKDEFLATLAHELRNPMAPIRNGLQVMRMAAGDWNAVEQARTMMDRQLTQLVRLVDDLMDISRISRGKIELRREQVQLAAVVNSAVETSRPLIEQMGHDLKVTMPQTPIVVDADLTRLAQVFLNLLNNSAKYTERGGRIWLTAERQGNDVVVSVKDNGIGIAADQLPRLFEMFSQLDHGLERSQGGLGIGLTLVKRLVEMHGGWIEAKSDGFGKGSEFIVHLPVVVVEASRREASRREETSTLKSSLRILVVDDNRDGADSLAMMLRVMGNDTHTAYDGEAAVSAALEYRPDVILLDIGLPKLTGYEACRRIRGQPGGKDSVIIAQTGWGQEQDRQRTHEAGFDHHLVKPVDPTALMKLLAELQAAKG
jgi:PAS domain S-box-containing protein